MDPIGIDSQCVDYDVEAIPFNELNVCELRYEHWVHLSI